MLIPASERYQVNDPLHNACWSLLSVSMVTTSACVLQFAIILQNRPQVKSCRNLQVYFFSICGYYTMDVIARTQFSIEVNSSKEGSKNELIINARRLFDSISLKKPAFWIGSEIIFEKLEMQNYVSVKVNSIEIK